MKSYPFFCASGMGRLNIDPIITLKNIIQLYKAQHAKHTYYRKKRAVRKKFHKVSPPFQGGDQFYAKHKIRGG